MSQTPEEAPVFVRVETESGAQVSVSAVYAESQGLKVLKDADATTPGGKPLSATYPEKKAAKKADSGQA